MAVKPKYFKLTKENKLVYNSKAESFLEAVEKYYPSLGQLILRSFLDGLFKAIGATVGLSLFVALITFILQQLKVLPIIGNFFNQFHVNQILPK